MKHLFLRRSLPALLCLTLTKQYDRYTHTTETRRKIHDDSDSGGSTSSCSGGGGSGRSGKF